MRNRLVLIMLPLLTGAAYADLGIMDNPIEMQAKTGAAGLGITQIWDHSSQISNGQFYVPITYNGNTGGENDPYHANSDIDYMPLNQLKGADGTNGMAGSAGTKGATGAQGLQGVQGVPGRDAEAPAIDPRLDVEIREYDAKHWSVSSYASFGMQTRTARYIVGQRLTLKIGSSYESRVLEAQNVKLKALQGIVEQLQGGH